MAAILGALLLAAPAQAAETSGQRDGFGPGGAVYGPMMGPGPDGGCEPRDGYYGCGPMMGFRDGNDDGWGWDHMDWDGGWWIVMGLGMVLFWALVILGVVWLVRSLSGDRARQAGGRPESALEILDRRLAEGAISPEEYRERRDIVRDSATGGGSP